MRRLKRTFRAALSPVPKHPRLSIGLAIGLFLVVATVAILASRNVPSPTGRASSPTTTTIQPTSTTPIDPAPRPTTTISFKQGCLTPECHATFKTAHTTHAPAAEDACATCHAPDAGEHTYPLLAGSLQSLCLSCHDTGIHKPIQHGALTENACLACHNPHASESPHLLNAASIKQTCDQCHAPARGNSRHQPYANADCTVCHDPHASDNQRLLLAGDGANHCALCHASLVDEIAGARYTHRDLERDCLACHAPHASDNAELLNAPAGSLCLTCHEDIRADLAAAVVTHDPVINGDHCLSCHAPHASNNHAMLLDDQATVCLSCHNQPLTTSDGRTIPDMTGAIQDSPFTHGPVEASHCSACHAVHGAQYDRLLSSINPAVLTGTFDIHNYALCFSCHDQRLVLDERTTVTTQFRDGDINLHHLHVHARGSRNCADCHAVHASTGPHLIAETVAYQGSAWRMPMEFLPTETGGSCAPGCHEQLTYDRSNDSLTEPAPEGAP